MKIIKIKSFTDPQKEYLVRHLDDGSWRCSCPLFIMKERQIGECKHIALARKNEQTPTTSIKTPVLNNRNTSDNKSVRKQHNRC